MTLLKCDFIVDAFMLIFAIQGKWFLKKSLNGCIGEIDSYYALCKTCQNKGLCLQGNVSVKENPLSGILYAKMADDVFVHHKHCFFTGEYTFSTYQFLFG